MHPITNRATLGALLLVAVACGGEDVSTATTATTHAEAAAPFTGNLAVSATNITMGSQFNVTETATNLTGSQVSFITVGIRRLGFDVVAAQKPRTGICRIAGSATCTSLVLAPYETQGYTLTLTPTAPGTYTIQGWTDSPYQSGGFSGSVTVTVH
ncbi:MAG TPA: BatD family protein [Anaeromyxobacter sp.]|nr:BatD family protein [Anaeromyxobacter sp.]